MKMQLKFPNNAYATLHSPHKYVSEDMDKNKKYTWKRNYVAIQNQNIMQ